MPHLLPYYQQLSLLNYTTQVRGEFRLHELEATMWVGCMVNKVKVGYSLRKKLKVLLSNSLRFKEDNIMQHVMQGPTEELVNVNVDF